MSSRREARERAMQALYAFTIGGDDAKHVLATVVDDKLGDDKTAKLFAHRLFLATMDMTEEADALVERHFEDIPPKVSINEAIEVAKRYSTAKSGKFINGILDAVLLDLHREGRLKKSGRGLVGMESLLTKTSAGKAPSSDVLPSDSSSENTPS